MNFFKIKGHHTTCKPLFILQLLMLVTFFDRVFVNIVEFGVRYKNFG